MDRRLLSEAGYVWLLWRGRTADDHGSGVLIGVFADQIAASDGAAVYRKYGADCPVSMTKERVLA